MKTEGEFFISSNENAACINFVIKDEGEENAAGIVLNILTLEIFNFSMEWAISRECAIPWEKLEIPPAGTGGKE